MLEQNKSWQGYVYFLEYTLAKIDPVNLTRKYDPPAPIPCWQILENARCFYVS